MDLTKIREPFGLLDDETQAALMAHAGSGGHIELFNGRDWVFEARLGFVDLWAYRAKPQPARKTVYPWDALDDRIKWAAVDQDGMLLLSGHKPYLRDHAVCWSIKCWHTSRTMEILKFQRGDEPWTETLQCRPGYEGDE